VHGAWANDDEQPIVVAIQNINNFLARTVYKHRTSCRKRQLLHQNGGWQQWSITSDSQVVGARGVGFVCGTHLVLYGHCTDTLLFLTNVLLFWRKQSI